MEEQEIELKAVLEILGLYVMRAHLAEQRLEAAEAVQEDSWITTVSRQGSTSAP